MIATLPRSEKLVIPGIVAGGLLQGLLCVTGHVDVGLLVCVYAAEAVVLVPFFRGDDWWDTVRVRLALVSLCVVAGAVGAMGATWTPKSLAAAGALWLVTVGTWGWEAWERRVPPWRVVTRGPAFLHMGIVAVGLLGLWWAHEHALLTEHGWPGTGAEAGDDAGVRLISALVESGVAPLTVPALALVVFRTMNEVFLELYRQLGSTSAASSSDAPSSSRTTA